MDGDGARRWASDTVDPSWLEVDLGAATELCRVEIDWEASYSTEYAATGRDASGDAADWTTLYSTTAGAGGAVGLELPSGHVARYLRLYGIARALPFGHSLYSLRVHPAGTKPPAPPPAPPDPLPPTRPTAPSPTSRPISRARPRA